MTYAIEVDDGRAAHRLDRGARVGTRHDGAALRYARGLHRDRAGQAVALLLRRHGAGVAHPGRGTWLFGVPIRGPILAVFGISALFLLASLGQGLLISVATKNQQLATQGAAVSSMLPCALLSGFVMPIDNMPVVMQYVTYAIPARYFVHALRVILLRDAPLSVVAPDAFALLLFATVMVVTSTALFRRRMMAMLLAVPCVQLVMLGYAANLEINHIDTMAVDLDHTEQSRESKTQQQALMGGFFVILPAMLLSGFMTPIEAMPAWVRPVTYVNPMRYFVEIVRSVLLRGATLRDVAEPLLLLTLLAAVVMGAATLRFRKQLG